MKTSIKLATGLLVAALAAGTAQATTYTWTGGGDVLWTNAANWGGTVPTNTDTAVFPTPATNNASPADLSATTQTISALTLNTTYSITNGTLSLNTINIPGNGSPIIYANVNDQGGNGLVFDDTSSGNFTLMSIGGQIAISSTASNAFSTVYGQGQIYGAYTWGSTNAGVTNSVAGGVYLADGLNQNPKLFQGTWTIGGDLQVTNGGNSAVQLKNTVSIGGKLLNATTAGQSRWTSLQILSGSAVSVGGDLIMNGASGSDITISQPLTNLVGNVLVKNGKLKLNVTDPIGNGSGGANTSKVFYLGDTSGTTAAQIEIDTNGKILNNPIIATNGSSGTATLYCGANGASYQVTYAGAITLNKGLIINAYNTAGDILNVSGAIGENGGSQGVKINAGGQVGTVQFGGANTYSGPTTINAGTLLLSGMLSNSSVYVASGVVFTQSVSGVIAGTGVTFTNFGTTVLGGTNTYTGGTAVNAGRLSFLTTNAQPASGTTTVAAGLLTLGLGVGGAGYFGSADLDNLFANTLANVSMNTTSLVGIDTSAGNWDYSNSVPYTTRGLNKLGANTLTLYGTNAYAGPTVITAGTLKLGSILAITNNGPVTVAGGILDLNGSSYTNNAITMTSGTISNGTLVSGPAYIGSGGTVYAILGGTGGLTNNSSTTTLTASNTYTGATAVNGGTLALQFNANNAGGVINTNTDIVLGSGATLSVLGGSTAIANTQTFNSTTLAGGLATVSLTKNTATSVTLNMGNLTNNTRAYLNFSTAPSATLIVNLNHVLDASGVLLGPWATVSSGTSLAYVGYTNATGGTIYSYADATTATAADLSNVTNATVNYTYGAATTLTNNQTGNTLRYTGGSSTTALGAYSLTLNGLMNAGSASTWTISGNAGSPGLVIGANGELDIVANTRNTTISSVISGTGALVYGGPSAGTLTLSGTNTYTGKTVVLNGTLGYYIPLPIAGVAGPLGAPTGTNAVIDLYPGVTFQYNNGPVQISQTNDYIINLAGTGSGTVTLNGANCNDTVFKFGGFTATGIGPRTLIINCKGDRPVYVYTGGIPDMSDGSQVTVSNVWSSGSSTSDGLINLQGTNTFNGPLFLTGGGNGGPGNFLIGGSGNVGGNVLTVTPGGTAVLGNGNYTNTITFTSGTAASVLFYYASSANQTLSGVISGPGALTMGGASTLTLSGANTYTGTTTVNGTNGVLRVNDGTGLPTNSLLTISYGVLETGANLVRTGGSAAGNMQITAGTSGFSANGGPAIVCFGTLGSPTALTWGTAPFQPGTLVLNEITANNKLNFTNAVALNGAMRTVNVNATNAAAIATMSGILSGNSSSGLTKGGAGTLALSGPNTYGGGIIVTNGTLVASNATALGSGTVGITNALLRLTQSLNISSNLSGNAGAAIDLGATGTVLTVSQGGNSTFAGAITNTGALTMNGLGTLALSGTNYSGATIVSHGILRLTNSPAVLGTNTDVYLAGGTLDLSFTGTNQVHGLSTNGITMLANGVYGSNGANLTGTGYLRVDSGLQAPTGLSALGLNAKVKLTWNVVTNADSYYLYRSATSNGSYTATYPAATNSYTDTNVVNGTLYWFAVQSTNSASGASPLSAWVSATPMAPTPPTFLGGGVSMNLSTGAAALTFGTQDGYEYRILYNDDLLTNVWTVVEPPADGWTNSPGGTMTITDLSATNIPQRFYRIEAR